jgi:protease I
MTTSNNSKPLSGRTVACLVTDGYEQSELTSPVEALRSAGAEVHIVSLKSGKVRGWKDGDWGESVMVDKSVGDVSADDYRGLLLPGGVINPDKLRRDEKAVGFVRDFFKQGKPVAAICHGPQMLIEADVVDGRTMTSFSSIRKDLENAGAKWVDREVVVDQGLTTSRSPADLPAFNRKMVEELAEGVHEGQKVSV